MEDSFLINTFILEDKIETKNFKIQDIISSHHDYDCCEDHYLDMEYIDNDNKMLAEQLKYFDKFEIYGIKNYGIKIKFFQGEEKDFTVGIIGRAYNNGYYSDDLTLIVKLGLGEYRYDITKCQQW